LRAAATQLRLTAGKQWKKFGVYSLVGWVAPLTLTTLVVVVEHLKDTVPDQYRPGFAEGRGDLCWFSHKKALLVYFAAPFAGVMIANAALFVASSLVIFDSTSAAAASKTSGGQRQNFWLYLKLAVVMGLGWSTGLAAGFADQVDGLWYAFIVLNTLQGLLIFVSFTCTRKVWRGARDRFRTVTFSRVLRSSGSQVTATAHTPVTSSLGRSHHTRDPDPRVDGGSVHQQGVDAITPAPSSSTSSASSPSPLPSRYGARGQTMYTVSRQQASSLTQHSFDGRFI